MFRKASQVSDTLTIHCRDTETRLRIKIADSFLSRLRGLMFTRSVCRGTGGAEGLLITRCPSVHTAFMRYPLDIVYIDASGTTLACIQNLGPWRAHVCTLKQARQSGISARKPIHAIELESGGITRLGIAIGDRWRHPLLDAGS